MLKPKQYRKTDIWQALDKQQHLYGHEAARQSARGYEAIQGTLCRLLEAEGEISRFIKVLARLGWTVAPEIGFDERIHRIIERFEKRLEDRSHERK